MFETRAEEALACPALLTPFNLLCYANLKKYTFDHQLSCPTLPSKWEVLSREGVSEAVLRRVEEFIGRAPAEQRGFFTVSRGPQGECKVDVLASLASPDQFSSIVFPTLKIACNNGRFTSAILTPPPPKKDNPYRTS